MFAAILFDGYFLTGAPKGFPTCCVANTRTGAPPLLDSCRFCMTGKIHRVWSAGAGLLAFEQWDIMRLASSAYRSRGILRSVRDRGPAGRGLRRALGGLPYS